MRLTLNSQNELDAYTKTKLSSLRRDERFMFHPSDAVTFRFLWANADGFTVVADNNKPTAWETFPDQEVYA